MHGQRFRPDAARPVSQCHQNDHHILHVSIYTGTNGDGALDLVSCFLPALETFLPGFSKCRTAKNGSSARFTANTARMKECLATLLADVSGTFAFELT